MKIKFSKRATKFLNSCEKALAKRILKKCEELEKQPFSKDTKRVIHPDNRYFRVRVGDYRILYSVGDIITIIKIENRSKVYKKLWMFTPNIFFYYLTSI